MIYDGTALLVLVPFRTRSWSAARYIDYSLFIQTFLLCRSFPGPGCRVGQSVCLAARFSLLMESREWLERRDFSPRVSESGLENRDPLPHATLIQKRHIIH